MIGRSVILWSWKGTAATSCDQRLFFRRCCWGSKHPPYKNHVRDNTVTQYAEQPRSTRYGALLG